MGVNGGRLNVHNRWQCRLCLNAAARMFAADPTDAACLAALAAFHAADKSMFKTDSGREAGGTVLPDGDTLLTSTPSPHQS